MSHPQPTPLTRRAVLQRGLAGIFAYAVSPNIFPSSLFGKNAPSNRLTVGLVGNGLICNAHIGTLLGRDDCRILAVSDPELAARYKAMREAKIDSPRGAITMSPAQNITQNIYLRRAEKGENKVIGVAAENLADPGTACKL